MPQSTDDDWDDDDREDVNDVSFSFRMLFKILFSIGQWHKF